MAGVLDKFAKGFGKTGSGKNFVSKVAEKISVSKPVKSPDEIEEKLSRDPLDKTAEPACDKKTGGVEILSDSQKKIAAAVARVVASVDIEMAGRFNRVKNGK